MLNALGARELDIYAAMAERVSKAGLPVPSFATYLATTEKIDSCRGFKYSLHEQICEWRIMNRIAAAGEEKTYD